MEASPIKFKQDLIYENCITLQKIIRLLLSDLESGKRRPMSSAKISDSICRLMRTQSTLLCDIPISYEIKVYMKILNAPGGRIKQQSLLSGSGDFDDAWRAINNLKAQGLIEFTGENLKEREILAVDQSKMTKGD